MVSNKDFVLMLIFAPFYIWFLFFAFFQDFIFVLSFLKYEHDIPRYRCFGIYPYWYSLTFLVVSVYHQFQKNSQSLLQYLLLRHCLFTSDILNMHMLHFMKLSHGSWAFLCFKCKSFIFSLHFSWARFHSPHFNLSYSFFSFT